MAGLYPQEMCSALDNEELSQHTFIRCHLTVSPYISFASAAPLALIRFKFVSNHGAGRGTFSPSSRQWQACLASTGHPTLATTPMLWALLLTCCSLPTGFD